jgi:ribose transport system permease protein
VKKALRDYGVLIAFAILLLLNIATRGANFLSAENLRNLVSQNSSVGIIALGMTFVIIAGGIDLSVGSLTAFCGAVTILTLNKLNGSLPLVALVSIAVGALAGLLNGLVVTYGRVASFVVTLAGLAAYRSAALVLGNGGEIRSTVPSFQDFGFGGVALPVVHTPSGGPVLLYWSAILFLLIAGSASFLLNYTRFGRYVIAVGANERAAHYSAIHTGSVRTWTFVLLGAMVGLAGFLVAARMNSVGTGSVGLYYELDAIAAVVIGGTSLRGGHGRIWGTVVGVLLLTLIGNMMTAYNIGADWQGMVRGAVILAAVLLQRGERATG